VEAAWSVDRVEVGDGAFASRGAVQSLAIVSRFDGWHSTGIPLTAPNAINMAIRQDLPAACPFSPIFPLFAAERCDDGWRQTDGPLGVCLVAVRSFSVKSVPLSVSPLASRRESRAKRIWPVPEVNHRFTGQCANVQAI